MTPNEYKQKLVEIFGYDCTAEKPKGMHKLSRHKCNCGSEFSAKPSTMLVRPNAVCLKCDALLVKQKHDREDFESKIHKQNMVCLQFEAMHKLAVCMCAGCGTIFNKRPNDIVKMKPHCKKSIDFDKTELLKYRGFILKSKSVVCGKCGGAFNPDLKKLAHTNCPHCNKNKLGDMLEVGQFKSDKPLYSVKGTKVVELWPDRWERNTAHCISELRQFNIKQARLFPQVVQHIYVEAYNKVVVLPKKWVSMTDMEIYAFVNNACVERITMLGIDPGTLSMGWTIIEMDKTFKPVIKATGMFNHMLRKIDNDINYDIKRFEHELKQIIEAYEVTHLTAERFQSRKMGGTTIECVNMMLGVIGNLSKEIRGEGGLNVLFVTPANWKNEWNRYSDLEHFYTTTKVADHQCDSMGQGLYGCYRWYGLKPFENIKKLEKSLALQLTKTNILGE